MNSYDNIISGYHCNEKNKLNEFINNGKILVSEDTHYLGDGMYFWDNTYDLAYWKEIKIKQASKGDTITSIKAKICYKDEELMDLTTQDQFNILLDIKKMLLNKTNNKNQKLGEIINKIFNSPDKEIRDIVKCIKVLKINLFYKNLERKTNSSIQYYSDTLYNNQKITLGIRTFYCVKCDKNALFSEIIEEVIK